MSRAKINIPSLPLPLDFQHFLLGCPGLQQSPVLVPSLLTSFSSSHVSELEQVRAMQSGGQVRRLALFPVLGHQR